MREDESDLLIFHGTRDLYFIISQQLQKHVCLRARVNFMFTVFSV